MTDGDGQPVLTGEQTFKVGEATTVMGPAPVGNLSAVFEDDGETGYFYGLGNSSEKQPHLGCPAHLQHAGGVRSAPAVHGPDRLVQRWAPSGPLHQRLPSCRLRL